MADLNALKTQLKEQNQRLLSVTQDKARLEAKNKINQMKEEDGVGKSLFTFIIRRAGRWPGASTNILEKFVLHRHSPAEGRAV